MHWAAIGLVCLVWAAPARAEDPAITDGSAQAALDQARGKWAAGGLVDYRFQVRRSCFCPEQNRRRYTIHVRSGEAVGAPRVTATYDTVPKLHAIVQQAIAQRVDGLDVAYNGIGVPTQISIDRSVYTLDEEDAYSARDVTEEDPTVPSGVDDGIETGAAAQALARARGRWRAEGLADYRFRQRLVCFCPVGRTKPRTLTVLRRRAVRPGKVHRRYATVPRLFRLIDRAIERRVSGLSVRYGKTGFPRRISIDYDDLAADEELGLVNTRLRRL